MEIKIFKSQIKNIIYFHIFYWLIVGFLVNDCGAPFMLYYILDLLVFVEIMYVALNKHVSLEADKLTIPVCILTLLFFVSFVGHIVRGGSIALYLYGFRNVAKNFLFLLSCAFILEESDIYRIMNILKKVLFINVGICTIQYFIFGITGDACNGLFGSGKANSWMNILLCIITAYYVALYLERNTKLSALLVILATCAYISTLAELKIYFFEMAFIIVIVILVNRPNRRTFMVIGAGIVGAVLIMSIMTKLWPESVEYLTLDGIQKYVSQSDYGYATVDDIGRIGGIGKMNNLFFDKINLFGYGLGNCDIGSPFYLQYEYLHYYWFTYMTTYMELGWVGLISYILFFVTIAVTSMKMMKHVGDLRKKAVFTMVVALSGICIMLMWYNSSIRNNAGTMIFMALAFCAILSKSEYQKIKDKKVM